MTEIEVGDLVQWESGNKLKVGVVKEIGEDGACTVSIQAADGTREDKIKAERLTRLTSTIKPEED